MRAASPGEAVDERQKQLVGVLVKSVCFATCFRELQRRASSVPVETVFDAALPKYLEMLDYYTERIGEQSDFGALVNSASELLAMQIFEGEHGHVDAKITIATHARHLLFDAAKEIITAYEGAA